MVAVVTTSRRMLFQKVIASGFSAHKVRDAYSSYKRYKRIE